MLLWIFEACDNKCELHAEFPKTSASLRAIKALPLIKDIFYVWDPTQICNILVGKKDCIGSIYKLQTWDLV
jgi:hypothetical protein